MTVLDQILATKRDEVTVLRHPQTRELLQRRALEMPPARPFTGALRRAIQVRDRECFHPMCDEPAENCEIDHIEPYAAGGDTVQGNGRPGCDHHNRNRHKRPQRDNDDDSDGDATGDVEDDAA